MEGLHRVGGVALSLPADLQVRDLRPGAQAIGHEGGHLQPLLGRGRLLGQVLVGRFAVGNDDQPVQVHLFQGCPGPPPCVPNGGGSKVPP